MDRRMVGAAALAVAALIGAACSNPGSKKHVATAPNAVTIQGFLFEPESLSILAGTSVVWKNTDDIEHTVTSGTPAKATGLFDSSGKTLGQAFTHTFGTGGTFPYFCKNHNSMTGSVTVS